MLTFQVGDPGLKVQSPFLIPRFFGWVDALDELHLLIPNLVFMVEFTQQRRVDTIIWELAMEENASLLEWYSCPEHESGWIA